MITPWFKLQTRKPIVDQPVEIGPNDHRAFLRRGWWSGWEEIARERWDRPFDATSLVDQESVLFGDRPSWQIIKRDGGRVSLPRKACYNVTISDDRKRIICSACSKEIPGDRKECQEISVMIFDWQGQEIDGWFAQTDPSLRKTCDWMNARVLESESGVRVAIIQCVGPTHLVSPVAGVLRSLGTVPREDAWSRSAWRAAIPSLRLSPMLSGVLDEQDRGEMQ